MALPTSRTLIADLNPNGRFLNPSAYSNGTTASHQMARQMTPPPQSDFGQDGDAQPVTESAAPGMREAQMQDYRNRVLFGDDGADLLSLSIPGFTPPRSGRDRDTGLPKYGKGGMVPAPGAFIAGDKTKDNPTGEEVVITSGPSMVIPKTALTKGKPFGLRPPPRDAKTGMSKYGNGGMVPRPSMMSVMPEEGVAPRDWQPVPSKDAAGSGDIPGRSPGQAIVYRQQQAKAQGLPMPRENAISSVPQGGSMPPPAPPRPPQSPVSARTTAHAPMMRGSTLAQNYHPIGSDYNPGGDMEQTRTGSFRHPIRMRQTDIRRAMRSPEGVSMMMREAATDKRFDRMDATRREDREFDRAAQLENRDYQRTEEDRTFQRGQQLSMQNAVRQRQWGKQDQREDRAYETAQQRQKREQDEADFRSFEEAPGNPDYLMNRRGMTLPKAKAEAPMPTPEEIQKRGLRPTGYDARGQPTGYEDAKSETFTVWDDLGRKMEMTGKPEEYDLTGYTTGPQRKASGQQQQQPAAPMSGGKTSKSGIQFQRDQ